MAWPRNSLLNGLFYYVYVSVSGFLLSNSMTSPFIYLLFNLQWMWIVMPIFFHTPLNLKASIWLQEFDWFLIAINAVYVISSISFFGTLCVLWRWLLRGFVWIKITLQSINGYTTAKNLNWMCSIHFFDSFVYIRLQNSQVLKSMRKKIEKKRETWKLQVIFIKYPQNVLILYFINF